MTKATAGVDPRNVRHRSSLVILFIDLINRFDYPDGRKLLKRTQPIQRNLLALKRRARKAGVPILYVNDNFGQWRSDARELIANCVREGALGKEFVSAIAPDHEDYFVLKPMHSAFYQTPLDLLLTYFEATTLVLCGISTNSCILCTAHDAKMRNLGIVVAADCCAAPTEREHERALEHLRSVVGASVKNSASIRLA